MLILSIDTSCDETAAAVTDDLRVLSNIIWSQASQHSKFGGVYPSLAQRMHSERIDFVVQKALKQAFPKSHSTNYQLLATNVDAIAVTIGPGLAPALEVGINKAKELAKKYQKPLIPVNHIEAHFLSPFAQAKSEKLKAKSSEKILNTQYIIQNTFPAFGLVVSGGTTQLILAEGLGRYKILASTMDDALGEALDKGARLLGLGYPGGAVLEKIARLHDVPARQAKEGDVNSFELPIPMLGRESEGKFSYSGLKTALSRTVTGIKNKKGNLSKDDIQNLAANYQNAAFEHLMRVTTVQIQISKSKTQNLLIGGGVGANVELRKRIRKMCRKLNLTPLFPYSNKLYGDNAAMIGATAFLTGEKRKIISDKLISKIDRLPRFSVEDI